jgi:hypothetical protein
MDAEDVEDGSAKTSNQKLPLPPLNSRWQRTFVRHGWL